jgi:para-nitrobenzyl esterase
MAEPALEIPAGAYHSSEVQYLLDRTGEPSLLDPAQLQLSAAMIAYWTTFAHTGDPNQVESGLPEWSPFDPTAAEPEVLGLAPGPDGIAPVEYAAAHNCDFWATLEID